MDVSFHGVAAFDCMTQLAVSLSMVPTPVITDIVARARGGSADALSELYARHGHVLVALAYHITGSRADAEDALHDVFLGLSEALQRYDERGSLDAWLRRVTARVAVGKLRARARRREVDLDHIIQSTAAKADRLGDLDAIQRAIATLPATLRAVFMLREVEGYSHAEIAELLDITPNASEVRMYRAIRSLRLALGGAPE